MLRIGRIPPRLIVNFRRGILRERMKIQDYMDAFQISMLYIAGVVGGMLFDRSLSYVVIGNIITFLTFLTFYRVVARKLLRSGFCRAVKVFDLDKEFAEYDE